MKLLASSFQLYCKRDLGADVFLWILWHFQEHFFKNSSGRLLPTLQVHKVDKNVSRYGNKDIEVIYAEATLMPLCELWKWFCMVKKLWKPPSSKAYQNLRNLQWKYLWQSFVITIRQTIFLQFSVILLMILKLVILWNFIWKLHIQRPVEQLRWSLFVENLLTYYSSKKVWGAFYHWGYTRESWNPPAS